VARIHVTSLAPENIVDEVVDTFIAALRRLGHDVSSQPWVVREDSLNILMFALGLDPAELRTETIVVNFEPLAPGTQAHRDEYLQLLRNNYVWEYSRTNLRLYPQLGLAEGFHVPLGFDEDGDITVGLDDRLPEGQRDIDVLFFGGPNERRDAVISQMRDMGLNVVTNENVLWPRAERDEKIRRAKVVLNMNRFEGVRIAEMPRISMLLRRRKAVVCELYPDTEIEPEIRSAVAGAPLERLAETARMLVQSPQLRADLEERGLDALRRFPQADFIKAGLERYEAWRRAKSA